jgi:hypothetical protein
MRCTRCGTENPTDSEYCYQCGHKVGFDVVREEEYERKSSNPIINPPSKKLSPYLTISFLLPFVGFLAAYLLFRRMSEFDDIELEGEYRRTGILCIILALFNLALMLIVLAYPPQIFI